MDEIVKGTFKFTLRDDGYVDLGNNEIIHPDLLSQMLMGLDKTVTVIKHGKNKGVWVSQNVLLKKLIELAGE